MFKTKLIFIAFSIILIFINSNCQKDIVDIPPDIDTAQPGRRDYVWTVDTLILPYGDAFTPTRIWGSSPNDVWITGFGDAGDLLWHFDGTRWTRDETRYLISPSALWGTDSNNIWLGNSNNTFWRYDGTKWYKFSQHSLNGYKRIAIERIMGVASTDVYAVGLADQPISGDDYKGVIMHFDGINWQFVQIPDFKTGFTEICRQTKTGLYFLGGSGYDSIGFNYNLFVFNGNTLSIINTNYSSGSHVYQIRDEVYFAIGKKIYKYLDNSFQEWKDFTNSAFRGVVCGRTEKDFFTYTTNGLGHFNGIDLQTVYPIPLMEINGIIVFENDVFVPCQSLSTGINTVLHGRLKNN